MGIGKVNVKANNFIIAGVRGLGKFCPEQLKWP